MTRGRLCVVPSPGSATLQCGSGDGQSCARAHCHDMFTTTTEIPRPVRSARRARSQLPGRLRPSAQKAKPLVGPSNSPPCPSAPLEKVRGRRGTTTPHLDLDLDLLFSDVSIMSVSSWPLDALMMTGISVHDYRYRGAWTPHGALIVFPRADGGGEILVCLYQYTAVQGKRATTHALRRPWACGQATYLLGGEWRRACYRMVAYGCSEGGGRVIGTNHGRRSLSRSHPLPSG